MNLYRLTTNGMLYTYRANLQNSYNTLAAAMTKVQTNRNFNSYAEDPAAATRAFQLRREHWQASTQVRNNANVLTTFMQAFSTFDSVKNDLADQIGKVNTLIGLNDPDATARKTLGQSILAAVEEAVQSMNVKYDGKFLFAGADAMNTPFTWEDIEVTRTVQQPATYSADDIAAIKASLDPTSDALGPDGEVYLTYPDNVYLVDEEGNKLLDDNSNPILLHSKDDPVLDDAGNKIELAEGMEKIESYTVVGKVDENGKPIQSVDADGNKITDANGDPVYEIEKTTTEPEMEDVEVTSIEKKLCYRGIPVDVPETNEDGSPNEDYQRLQTMMNETVYVDIGLGMKELGDTNSPITSTVYNSALSGLEFLDFGLDEDGDPKNVVSLMYEIGQLLMTSSDVDGTFAEGNPSYDKLNRLCSKLEAAENKMHVEYTELTTKAAFLESNGTRLTENVKALNEQILDIEEIDPVEAITSLSWAQYCYNAGLKIGNSLLSQTLLDYMS